MTTARLPFLENPLNKLSTNKEKAMAVYKGQARKLDKNSVDKSDVMHSRK